MLDTREQRQGLAQFVQHILRATNSSAGSRVLSIGCGIGDMELLLAPHVAHVTGIDLSPAAIAEACRTASARGVNNVRFIAGTWQTGQLTEVFDVVVAIFFLHHLPEASLQCFPTELATVLRKGGMFYALDPSNRRLAGVLGELLVPNLMKKYRTADEHELRPKSTEACFRAVGFETITRWFDFTSTPIAGLFPSWAVGYRLGRCVDEGLTRLPLLRELSSNFELIGRNRLGGYKPGSDVISTMAVNAE